MMRVLSALSWMLALRVGNSFPSSTPTSSRFYTTHSRTRPTSALYSAAPPRRRRSSFAASSSASQQPPKLETPTVLYQDNHLLVVNKPVGWHSVPNPGDPSPKCLVQKLQSMKLGGGSHNDFLHPLHRIDQPCSGVLLLGKTSKAASRITTAWKKKSVQKEYLVVVESSQLNRLYQASQQQQQQQQWLLQGEMQPRKRVNTSTSQSVRIRPVTPTNTPTTRTDPTTTRVVSLLWKPLPSTTSSNYQLLSVQTTEGAKHMVRALLAQVGNCPVLGDVRYRASSPLPDQSVALHAYRVSLDPSSLQLGTLNQFEFRAPIPTTWKHYFGIQLPVANSSQT